MKKYRLLQLWTMIHYIHHIWFWYGFKFPFIEIGYFKSYRLRYIGKSKIKGISIKNIQKSYHNCTVTGQY